MSNIGLIIAGGSGVRMGQNIPKQFLTVNEKPVIVYTLEAFEKHPEIDSIAVVCISGWEQVLWAYAQQFNISKLQYVIEGGDCGQASIRNGVLELEKHYAPNDIIMIHDAIRPMVSAEIISDCLRITKKYGNATTVIPCAEAMIETEDSIVSTGSYNRDKLKNQKQQKSFRHKWRYLKKMGFNKISAANNKNRMKNKKTVTLQRAKQKKQGSQNRRKS